MFMMDLLVRRARVVDETGQDRFEADITVWNGAVVGVWRMTA